jgi:hypothetical protein
MNLQLQGDKVFLQDFYAIYVKTKLVLEKLKGNVFATQMIARLANRVLHTADGRLAEIAYLMTPEGFAWFAARRAEAHVGNFLERPSIDDLALRIQINKEIETMRSKLIMASELFGVPDPALGIHLDEYLDGKGPPGNRDMKSYWRALADDEPDHFAFARIAWILLQIPAHEASAERAFSVFEALFPRVRMSASQHLLSAELRIRLEQLYQVHEPGIFTLRGGIGL